jgi:hexosaminidase
MKRISLIIFLFSTLASFAQQPEPLSLMPIPASVSTIAGRFQLTENFTISIKADQKDTVLFEAVNRMFNTLNRRTGLYFRQQFIKAGHFTDTASMLVIVKQKESAAIGVDESYQLTISDRQVIIRAENSIGAIRALETILQLATPGPNGFYFPLVTISDHPRFKWRGLMIDVARHFIPMDVLKRNIDAMAAVKLNVLHLHLTDDQGFRVESKLFPLLQEKGSNGNYYTQTEIRDMIIYAAKRGIIVVPEFDIPGHTTSWFAGYPALATRAGSYEPGAPYKIDHSKQVNPMDLIQTMQTTAFPAFHPAKESVYQFLEGFIAEISALFPSSYFHIGADEVNGVVWKQDSGIVAFMRKNNLADTKELQAYFVNRVYEMVKKQGKKMIGWEELFTKDLPSDVVVQVWSPFTSSTLIQSIKAKGNPVILSKGFYLDYFMPAYIHYDLEFPSEEILGGEAAQWTELADAENIETRIWPRMAAIAEKFWSPKEVRDSMDMYRRLFITADHLAEAGLCYESNYDRMILRFSAGEHYTAMHNLMDVLTPEKGVKRIFASLNLPESYSYPASPMMRAADIAQADPRTKWEFRKNVEQFLRTKDSISGAAIRGQLLIWSVNYDQLRTQFQRTPGTREIEKQSEQLSALSAAALQAIEWIRAGQKPPFSWMSDHKELFSAANGIYGETELSVYPELMSLIEQRMIPLPVAYPLF